MSYVVKFGNTNPSYLCDGYYLSRQQKRAARYASKAFALRDARFAQRHLCLERKPPRLFRLTPNGRKAARETALDVARRYFKSPNRGDVLASLVNALEYWVEAEDKGKR